MEKVEVPPLHSHPLIPFTRFASSWCKACSNFLDDYADCEGISDSLNVNLYGGYRCNELEYDNNDDDDDVVFHKECGKPLQEINHSSHPEHSLKLVIQDPENSLPCSFCGREFKVVYCCSTCDFKLDFVCARRPEPLVLPANSYGHVHPLQLVRDPSNGRDKWDICNECTIHVNPYASHYKCHECDIAIHVDCVDFYAEAYHSSHPKHPLKSLKGQVPDYAEGDCLLCGAEFDGRHHQLHHCDICNFSICRACMKNPPPVHVECGTTHEHRLLLVPRLINFTCDACGTQGDRSLYFCSQCNFMIHRQCIGLPRVININRHNHRVAYTPRLGHGEWKCRVCREKVDGFYGAYTCVKCPTLAVHALCATDKDVWDMVEREGTPEEEDIMPFEVINDTTIKHFSHDHNLRINKDRILPEKTLCVACVFQICSEPFYSCEQCDFILHEKCAHLPRETRHVRNNTPFTLHTDARDKTDRCGLCCKEFTGFRYKSGPRVTIDVRCGSTSDSIEHDSHEHPLYYYSDWKRCSHCGDQGRYGFGCFECGYFLNGECALLPRKVTKKRYDDHPLFLWYGDKNVAGGEYWCEVCEKKVDPKKWFYTCNDCAIALHVSCVVGDWSYIMPGSVTCLDGLDFASRGLLKWVERAIRTPYAEVVSNNSICRRLCSACNTRCKLSSILKLFKTGDLDDDVYICSPNCHSVYMIRRR